MHEDGELSSEGRLISWVTTPRCNECEHYVRSRKRHRRRGMTVKAKPGHCMLGECCFADKRGAEVAKFIHRSAEDKRNP